MSAIPAGYFEDSYKRMLDNHLRRIAGKPRRGFSPIADWPAIIAKLDTWVTYRELAILTGLKSTTCQQYVSGHPELFVKKQVTNHRAITMVKRK